MERNQHDNNADEQHESNKVAKIKSKFSILFYDFTKNLKTKKSYSFVTVISKRF
jgi:hypothetical protein